MSRLVLDIETAGLPLDSLDEGTREYMLRGAETDEGKAEVAETLSFYPVTAEVAAIGVLNPDTLKGAVYFQTPGVEPMLPFEEQGIRFVSGTEADVLENFWDMVKKYRTIVTYNGRGFDCPFLLVRSAVHRIKPTKDIMPPRFNDDHIDLMDRISFFGSVRRKFSLDIWCRAMGIESPKSEVKGYEVTGLFREGRFVDIARYCAGDLRATAELFKVWEQHMKFPPAGDVSGAKSRGGRRGS